ncbi:MAG: hypothetical protein CMD68_03690 [Gammaproteobacteria bacterium]|nr:hypothetical protein [Gammaproteobacteria bacterium]|tara:strand:+ start:2406 stop:3518 length:1113 start_codon:yes stop_codon:yes gene_type:complete
MFNGLGVGLHNLSQLSNAQTRAITAENFDGSVGGGGRATEGTGAFRARDLGQTWKVSPSVDIPAGETFTLANIEDQGAIQHFWIVTSKPERLRNFILRMYWDGQENPSVEVPLGDFFASGLPEYGEVDSIPVAVAPACGFNCYWEMPFRTGARVTLENREEDTVTVYYQIDYTLTEVPEGCAYFHAQFRRSNPVGYKQDHVLVDGIEGHGQFIGCYMVYGALSDGWWGEGEVKFFIDDDKDFPTICGTGTEDYFGGSYNWDPGTPFNNEENRYIQHSRAYCGVPQISRPDGVYRAVQRFGMYRWHIPDPVRFQSRFRATIQCLGWMKDHDVSTRRYKPRRDDIASTCFWYQTLPTAQFPSLQSKDELQDF